MKLHIAASLRIVAKHLHMPKIPIADARDAIQRRAERVHLTRDDELMIEELERATGMSIEQLAEVTKKWLPKG